MQNGLRQILYGLLYSALYGLERPSADAPGFCTVLERARIGRGNDEPCIFIFGDILVLGTIVIPAVTLVKVWSAQIVVASTFVCGNDVVQAIIIDVSLTSVQGLLGVLERMSGCQEM